ncbi:probable cytochrome P450 4aa1 [Thrips palmi]|uniref:Probable cytochrome P450 4aa1 n=1 Tax=Thrips palmi TaxID=161013 RepID=A0A6P8YU31_THRPL|nr:probable cytochrome P450 4aa1 [Thrips palmi]
MSLLTAVTGVTALAVVVGVVVLLARYLRSYLHFRKLELAIPGPPSLFLLGNALSFCVVTPDTVMRTLLAVIGGRRQITRFSLFNNLTVWLQDPEEVEEMVRSKKFADKPSFIYSLLHIIAKKGLIQLNGAEWKAHRKWLQPGFNVNVLHRFVDIFSEEGRAFVERVEADRDVDVITNLKKASVRNFLRTSMSSDTSEYEDEAMDCCAFLELFLRSINNRSFNPILWSDRVFAWTPLGKRVHKDKQVIDKLCNRFIEKKRAEIGSFKNDSDFEQARKTLMDIMLDPPTGSQELTEGNAILDEFITFFGANVETTVSALGWTLKVLSLLPDVQQRVHAELDSVFGDSDRSVSVEDLAELQYLNRVIKEVMRMFPAIPFIGRHCYEETKLCGHTIPAGTPVFISIYGVHRDPRHWDRPEQFDPDRFLPERSKDRHPCAYMPFSMGPRKCIGDTYAVMNMTTFLATALRDLEVLPVGDHKDLQSLTDNMTFDLSSHLVGGTRVRFRRRGAKAAH